VEINFRILWSDSAINQLKDIFDYHLIKATRNIAQRLIQKIIDATEGPPGINAQHSTLSAQRSRLNSHISSLTTQPSKQSINISFQAPGQKE
jgi:plasmid stabilization system protein ParE